MLRKLAAGFVPFKMRLHHRTISLTRIMQAAPMPSPHNVEETVVEPKWGWYDATSMSLVNVGLVKQLMASLSHP